MGATLIHCYRNDPHKVWLEHKDFQKHSPSAVFASQQLIKDLFDLALKDFSSRHAFIERFDSLIQTYDDITMPPLDGNMKVYL